jgi:hypothetical protein
LVTGTRKANGEPALAETTGLPHLRHPEGPRSHQLGRGGCPEQVSSAHASNGISRPQAQRERTTLQPKQFPQAFGLRPAHRDFALLLVCHAQLIRTLEPGNNLADVVDVHQI